MEKWVHKYNMTFKSMAQQNRDKGYSFFKTKELEGYKKEVSPDWVCAFVMSDPIGRFHIFQFNPFTSEITERKVCQNKQAAKHWLDNNRSRLVWTRI